MFKELFDNPIIGFAYGFICAILGGLFMLGEINLWAFALVFGLVFTCGKEIINRYVVGNFYNKWNILFSIVGNILGSLFFI